MVCQLESTTTTTTTTTTTKSEAGTVATTLTSTPNKNSNRSNQHLLSSLSLTTILTSTPQQQAISRRTTSTILQNETVILKNALSLDNLEIHQDTLVHVSNANNTPHAVNISSISNEYLSNEHTLVQSMPDLDALVLNKCYSTCKSNLSLSNKINGDSDVDDEGVHEEDDDFDVDVDLINSNHRRQRPVVISSESSTNSDAVVQTQVSCNSTSTSASCLSTSPSISLSQSETKSINDELQQHPSSPPPIITNSNRLIMPLNPNYLAAEIASLSSLTSNYSQFDFLQTTEQQQPQVLQEEKKSSFSSFFNRFTSSKSKSYDIAAATAAASSGSSSASLFSGAFKLFQSNSSNSSNENKITKSNSDYTVPSSVLILENRPSNLPAKSNEEALKHKQEYEKMIEIAKKKEQKEKELKMKKFEQQIKKEDFMANSLRIWNTEILANWCVCKDETRTQQLWWHGLPPSIRGKVWKLAIGNELSLTEEQYHMYVKKAQEKIEILSRRSSDYQLDESTTHESSVELIKLDVSRTFPQLCFFQRDGPYHDALHSVLGAYACYNPKIGYVQGMSFLAAILLLNMESSDAFICLSNLLNNNYLIACFCMDQYKMNCYFKIHEILFEHNIPKLFQHFENEKIKPDLYLIEWIFTLFSKSLPLDVVSRVWDVYLRDKEEFLFRTALGILNMYKDVLLEMDFENIVNFLTKLPEDMNSTHLFKSIESMKTNIDNDNIKFCDLVAAIVG